MRHLTLALMLFAGVTIFGDQSPSSPTALAFEAASIRTTSVDRPYTLFERNNPGYFTVRNITVRGLISFAYFAQPYEVVDGPDWIDRNRFDVVAVAQGRSVRDNYTMVQTLLADRLSLRLRTEMREMPVYVLQKTRDDGKLGPGLRPVTIDCEQRRATGNPRASSVRAAAHYVPSRCSGRLSGLRAVWIAR